VFFLTVADSGERKSRVDDLALWPVSKHEEALREKHVDDHLAWLNDNEAWEKQRVQILGDKKRYPDQASKRAALEDIGAAPKLPP
jgi:hypothetical protein